MSDTINLTPPEAAIALSAIISFADDNPTEEEGVILRKYYRHETAEALQQKLDQHGLQYPADLAGLEAHVLGVIGGTDTSFQMRTMAVCYLLARADGNVDQQEMTILSRACKALGFSLADVEHFAAAGLKELDETSDYDDSVKEIDPAGKISFTLAQAGIALASAVAFSDGDPSDLEAAVIREHYSPEDAEGLEKAFTDADLSYPEDLPKSMSAVKGALRTVSHQEVMKVLAVAWKAAHADGDFTKEEELLIRDFCETFEIGLAELKQYFVSTPG